MYDFSTSPCHASDIECCKKDNKSGVDGISPKILKETVEQTSKPLAYVFNMSLQEGIVTLEWNEVNIINLLNNVLKKQVCKL